MDADADFRAILAADCGIERTRVSLVDIVEENEYRLVAQCEVPSTVDPPLADVTIAVRQAIAELEARTGRQLLEDGRLRIPQGRDGQGVDALVATCSAGGPLPILVLAVTADITARSAVRALEGTYAVPIRVVTMDEVLQNDPLAAESPGEEVWWKVIERLYPGGVLLVGGVDGGNVAPGRALARFLAEALPPRPTRLEQEVPRPPLPVIYAGNRRAQEAVQRYLAEVVDLRLTENVRPGMREENLLPARREIARLYEEQVLQRLPGYEELASWAQGPVQMPYLGLQLVARFLAAHYRRRVLVLDLGSASTTLVWAAGEACGRVVLGQFGMGYGLARVLAHREAARIRRWLPFSCPEEEVRARVLNRYLRPRTLPTTVEDVLLQQALAREALAEGWARMAEEAGQPEMVVATGGGLARMPRFSQVVLVLLDALAPTGENPTGLVDLYLDRSCLLPSVGALAALNPDAAACVLLKDALLHLGPCLVPLGRARPGAKALDLELEYAGEMRQEVEVRWGDLALFPFRIGDEAHITVRPARGVHVGQGRPGEQVSTRGGEMVRGGALGLIVDARGRPLPLPEAEEQRREALRSWLQRCGAWTEVELAGLPGEPPAAMPSGEVAVEELLTESIRSSE
ncbi:MAG: glutamate mutase L [Chloroflexia bacterium]